MPSERARASPSEVGSIPVRSANSICPGCLMSLYIKSLPILPDPMMATFTFPLVEYSDSMCFSLSLSMLFFPVTQRLRDSFCRLQNDRRIRVLLWVKAVGRKRDAHGGKHMSGKIMNRSCHAAQSSRYLLMILCIALSSRLFEFFSQPINGGDRMQSEWFEILLLQQCCHLMPWAMSQQHLPNSTTVCR